VFNVSYKLYFTDTVHQAVKIKMALPQVPVADPIPSESPQFFSFPGSGNTVSGVYNLGDSLTDSLSIEFNKINIPFYFQVLELQIWDSTDEHILSKNRFMVYFTPYHTIEIWNSYDFESLPRIWMSHTNDSSERIFIHKDSIPVSDLSIEDLENDSIPLSFMTIDGLGYRIPIHYVEEEDDDELSGMSFRRDDGCNKGFHQRWRGNIFGRVQALIRTDAGNNLNIPIEGMKVRIMRQRKGMTDEELGVVYTNNAGEFTRFVNVCANKNLWPNYVNIYFIFETINQNRSVKALRSIGSVRSESTNNFRWNYNNGNDQNLGNMGAPFQLNTANLKPQLFHWANRCRNFVNQELHSSVGFSIGSPNSPLVIKPLIFTDGGMFIPAGYKYTALAAAALIWPTMPLVYFAFTDKDGIYIEDDDFAELDEDLMYHEFGHYLMWHLQGKAFKINIFDDLLLHQGNHGFDRNVLTPNLAWTEGWAGGIGAIFDIAFRNEDNEAGLDGGDNLETRRLWNGDFPEEIEQTVRFGGAPGVNIQNNVNTVTHGFVSEMNIVCAILDMYDGPGTKANFIANNEVFRDNMNVVRPGLFDDVSLSFAQICRPLLNRQGTGLQSNDVIQNVTEYAHGLAMILPCSLKHWVHPIFDFNAVRDFENDPENIISTDVILRLDVIQLEHFKDPSQKQIEQGDVNVDYFLHSINPYTFWVDVPVINDVTRSFNMVQPLGAISDPIVVTDGESLRFNNNITSNWVDGNDPPPTASTLTSYFCTNEASFNEGGRLVVGDWDSTSGRYANTHIGNGSRVVLEGGTTVSELVINNKSKLIIDEGGVLEVHPGARIILNGTNAVLEVKGEIRMMENADFTVEGGAQGFGYIKFHKHWNDNVPKLVTGMGNNNITLEGNGTSHKLIEITGNEGWFVPTHFTDVSISNCLITLGAGSRLNMENKNKLTITNVEMKKISTGQSRHKGLYVWGWGMYSEIDNLTVSGGIQGIYY
jgi:hypothetical protein